MGWLVVCGIGILCYRFGVSEAVRLILISGKVFVICF